MKTALWLAGAALLAVAAFAVYGAFQSPDFVAGLSALAAAAVLKAVVPVVTRRMSPKDEAEWRQAEKAGRGEEWLRKRRGAPPKG